ncbi:hypothetical protein PP178_04320 [Zeaxanthinibacter sp. PT1]|uniref:hypothetical protein n=1 Tax=Zeaxanthinibacter TaxID=561554 RepID=UPI002348F1B4|nr:hypothetical protein [Zeaxanthinibacter sp. PT1]MDC6350765.1 hypothetical protein [Zeaxanthinibacter sp. PT1]
MSKTYEPMTYHITLDLPQIEEKTKTGIYKSDAMLEEERKKFTGAIKVVHVGPEVKQIKPGDKVLLANNAMLASVNIFGRALAQTSAHSVLGILRS